MPKYKLVIFDFDDTIGHLTIRWSDVKKELLEWAGKNGAGIDPDLHVVVISNKLSERPEGKRIVVETFAKYESLCVRRENYLMFPSMIELMKDLKNAGCQMAIATGNNVKTVSDILQKEKLDSLIELIVGIDSVRFSKPDPETLEIIIKRLGIEKKDAIFIGNSDYDVVAGERAGIKTIKIRTLWEDDVTMLRYMLL
jgi:HAD superfamily hydrolase (TIGR01549 family)